MSSKIYMRMLAGTNGLEKYQDLEVVTRTPVARARPRKIIDNAQMTSLYMVGLDLATDGFGMISVKRNIEKNALDFTFASNVMGNLDLVHKYFDIVKGAYFDIVVYDIGASSSSVVTLNRAPTPKTNWLHPNGSPVKDEKGQCVLTDAPAKHVLQFDIERHGGFYLSP